MPFEANAFLDWMSFRHPGTSRSDAARAWGMGMDNNQFVKEFYEAHQGGSVLRLQDHARDEGDGEDGRPAKVRSRRRSNGLHQARGMKTIVHVNQHVIKSNLKSGEVDPVLTVKTYKTNTYAHEVEITGPCKVIYSPDKPLSCGARVWIETQSEVIPVVRQEETALCPSIR
jgi:hypothetical protein